MSIPAFDFSPRTRLIFGAGSIELLGKTAQELNAKHVLLITDAGIAATGHLEKAIRSLQSAGVQYSLFDAVHPNPTTADIEHGTAWAKPLNGDMIVGLGGGSSMDCAKGINFLLTNGGHMQDYKGLGHAKLPMLPFIAIPTTSGTGSEAQSYAVISDAETHMKMACGDRKALACAALLDPELTVTMPFSVTAATGIDALSHALETAVTTRRNLISEMFSRQAWSLMSQTLRQVLSDGTDIDARGNMQLGAFLAGSAIENSMLGATHALSNPVSAHFEITHGIAIGVLLPYVIQYNSKDAKAAEIYAELARSLGSVNDTTEVACQKLVDFVRTTVSQYAKQPLTLKECGVTENLLPQMAEEAALQWTGTFNPRPVDPKSLLEIYRCAFTGTDVSF